MVFVGNEFGETLRVIEFLKLPVKVAESTYIIEVCQKPSIVLLIFCRHFLWTFDIFTCLLGAKINTFADKVAYVFNCSLAFIVNVGKLLLRNGIKQFQTRLEDIISKVNDTVIVITVELLLLFDRPECFYQDCLLELGEVAFELLFE